MSLFPLDTVLFPKQVLPLHIFEERYKTMIGRCIEEGAPFGVVLIRSGKQVGGDAVPHDVGTTARIARVQRLPDGKINLITLGGHRFRVLSLDRSEPYLTGDVEYLISEAAEGGAVQREAERVATLFAEQFRLVMAVSNQWTRELNLPGEADALADFVAAQIEVPADVKQELLETLPVLDRLRRETELLGELIRTLTQRWEEDKRKRFAGAGLN
ncbi:MAG: LON peptidase substrate-binding domain-containing protein [Chloroflexi bacterium]|nr:LON peptidase substrate-binding domain-containing protein [Chloroflexota bacterium]